MLDLGCDWPAFAGLWHCRPAFFSSAHLSLHMSGTMLDLSL